MSRVRLGELLLSRGLCTREQLAEAWEQKVLYGDRLGTNLLSLGILDEEELAATLGAQHGVHGGHGGVLKLDPVAVSKLPKNVAVKRGVIPHHIADRTLYLLMRDPDDLRAIDDVRSVTRLKVQPVAVCEARLWRLLSDHYGSKAPLRPNPLDLVRKAPMTTTNSAPTFKAPTEDLVSEEEFQLLYARLAGRADADASDSGPLPRATTSTEAPAYETPIETPLSAESEVPVVTAEASSEFPFLREQPQSPPVVEVPEWAEDTRPIRLRLVAGTVVPEPTSWDTDREADDVHEPIAAEEPTTPDLRSPLSAPVSDDWQRTVEVTNPMRAVPKSLGVLDEIQLVEVVDEDPDSVPPDFGGFADLPRTNSSQMASLFDLSPLSFNDAVEALKTATGRDDIARIVLRAARSRFARACVLTVYPHAFVGWQGAGEGFETDKLVEFALPRTQQSVFSLVTESRAHYLGPLQRFPAHGLWVKATGRKLPKSLAVLPVLVRGRTVNLLVVDNGHDQHVGSDVGELLILSRHIAGTYESLIQKG